VSIPPLTMTLRVLVLVLPPVAALLMWKVCHDLAAEDPRIAEMPADWPPVAGALGSASTTAVPVRPRIPARLARALVVPLAALIGFVLGRSRRRGKVTRL
jgi:hypothetical protein